MLFIYIDFLKDFCKDNSDNREGQTDKYYSSWTKAGRSVNKVTTINLRHGRPSLPFTFSLVTGLQIKLLSRKSGFVEASFIKFRTFVNAGL